MHEAGGVVQLKVKVGVGGGPNELAGINLVTFFFWSTLGNLRGACRPTLMQNIEYKNDR